MYKPKHKLARLVRQLPHRLRLALTALLGVFMAAGIGLAVTGAGAGVSGTVVKVTDGQAGYLAFGGRFERVYSVSYLRAEAQAQGAPVGQQVCDPSTGDAVQVGAVPSGTGWSVEWAAGQLTAHPGTANACAGNGLLSDPGNTATIHTVLSAPGAVPSGDQLAFTISYHRHGNGFNNVTVEVRNFSTNTFTDDWNASCDASPDSATSCGFSTNWPQFRTAGIGTQEDPSGLSAPPVNLLDRPTSASLQAYNGTSGALGGGFWTAQPVATVVNGTPLVVPVALAAGGSTFKVFAGSATSPQPVALGRRSIIGD